MFHHRHPLMGLVATIAFLALTSCSTLEYRSIQDEFNSAVRADNELSFDPLAMQDSSALYKYVATQLTEDFIAKLPEAKLMVNAYTLRAVSQWRLQRGEDAQALIDALVAVIGRGFGES